MRGLKLTCFLAVALSVFVSLGARAADEYIDKLFAPPAAEELQEVFDKTQYQPSCVDFATDAVYMEDADYVVWHATYKSDGLKQTGLFGLPKTPGRAPLAMINHAGFSGFSDYDRERLRQYLKRGYVVAVATYRGEAGSAGAAEGKMDVLGDEAHDIMNLMECAAAQPSVDPDKIVMMGVSHGAGLSVSVLIRSKRVRAAGLAAAPTNLMDDAMRKLAAEWRTRPAAVEVMLEMLIPKEGIKKMKQILGIKARNAEQIPPARFEMIRRSPALFADKIQVPMMLYYGGQDPVARFEDGALIEKSLKSRGIFCEMTVFGDRGHAFSPEESEAAHAKIIDFFDSVLKRQ